MKNISLKLSLWKLSAFCLTVLLLSGTTLHAEHDPLKGLAGPPFTDPSEIQPMPEDWEKQPIKYKPSAQGADIVISLDQHLYPVFLPVIQEYAKEHNMKIKVIEGTCGIAAGMLSRKIIDIGGYCCAPGITDRLPNLRFHTVGVDPLALLVHPSNPIDNITLEQARKIFMGDIYLWSELKISNGKKGLDIPIQPVGRLHCKLRPGHWCLLLADEDLFSPSLIEVGAIPDMISQVAQNPGAIGYEVLWNPIRYKEKGKVKALKINGYSPRRKEHTLYLRYPLYRVYGLTTWEGKGLENPKAQKLVEFLLKQSEEISREHNIIPVSHLRKAGWKFKSNELIGEPN